jgi:hypothetical protein
VETAGTRLGAAPAVGQIHRKADARFLRRLR